MCVINNRKTSETGDNMKPANMTHNFCTYLEGLTLPSGVIYGNVSGVTYYYNPDTKKLSIYDKYASKWRFGNPDKYTKIMHYVHAFMRSADYHPEKVRWCQYKQEQRDKEFRDNKRLNRDLVRKRLRHEREILACGPQEKRPQGATGGYMPSNSVYSQSCVDGKSYSFNWSDISNQPEENPFPVHGDENRPLLKASDPNRNFYENAEGKYVTITKRDGINVNQVKAYRDFHKNNTPEPTITQRYAEKAAEIRKTRETPEYERYAVKRVASARKRAEIAAINYGKRAIPV